VLLVKQRGGPWTGAWLFPGGGVDPGESIEDAARRETREETGCDVIDLKHVATYEVDERTQNFRAVVHMFRGTAVGETKPEAGSAVRWSSPTAGGYHPALRRGLADAGLRAEDEVALSEAMGATKLTMRRVR
jgi:8-oxo-dGTP diphosphatase